MDNFAYPGSPRSPPTSSSSLSSTVSSPAKFSQKRPHSRESSSPAPFTPSKRPKTSHITAFANKEILSPQLKILCESPISPKSDFKDYYETQFLFCKEIARGEICEVIKVQSRNDNLFYAIKKSCFPYIGKKQREERLMEVECLKKLKGAPNCLQLIESWEQSGKLFMRTPFYSRGSLKTLMDEVYHQDQHFSSEEIWMFLKDLATGLRGIHCAGIAHLDIKSENIYVTDQNQLIIGDFGIAVFVDSTQGKKLSQDGDGVYLAPELLKGEYSQASDIFSLGLVILELCTSIALPQTEPEYSLLRSNDPTKLDSIEFHSGFTPELKELLLKMLSSDPIQRPSADQILQHPRILNPNHNWLVSRVFRELCAKVVGFIKQVISPSRSHQNLNIYSKNNNNNMNTTPNKDDTPSRDFILHHHLVHDKFDEDEVENFTPLVPGKNPETPKDDDDDIEPIHLSLTPPSEAEVPKLEESDMNPRKTLVFD